MDTSFINGHLWEWTALVIVLLFLIYAAYQINREYQSYEEDARKVHWNGWTLLVPNWWTLKVEQPFYLEFQRSDTFYEWMAVAQKVDLTGNLQDCAKEFFLRQEIQFDEDLQISQDPQVSLGNREQLLLQIKDFVRVEGMATEKNLERIYLDSCWIHLMNGEVFHLYSYSSVLNGCLEGPYFEEVLKRLELNQCV